MKAVGRILLGALLIVALLGGCAKKPSGNDSKKPSLYFTYNDATFTLGETFESVKDKLGAETKPAETTQACDPNSDFAITMHFYDGITVSEENKGIIYTVEISQWEVGDNQDAALNGSVRLGGTPEDVTAALGEPESTDEYGGMYYTIGEFSVSIYTDDETGKISIISATFNEK